jgi:penicillin amidase
LDLNDLRAKSLLPDLIKVLSESSNKEIKLALEILEGWNCKANKDSTGACIFYPFLDRFWQRKFMHKVLGDDLINTLPLGAPGLNRFDIASFLKDKFWKKHESSLKIVIEEEMKTVVERVKRSLGDDPSKWRWGDLHKIEFKHSLNKFDDWRELYLGPDEIGGSPTTLGMAMHMGKGPGKAEKKEIPCRVYHGPAYRLVVDLNDPEHAKFVIAGGNGGRVDSKFCLNHYSTWLKGSYFTLNFNREEIDESFIWQFEN